MDLVVSSWTLRYLVDPVGTVFRCLKEKQGIFLGDGFFFAIDATDSKSILKALSLNDYVVNLYKLFKHLHDSEDSILIYGNKDQYALDNFILLKNVNKPNIPFEYKSFISLPYIL